ncbi:unnamed protein product [Rhizoctonia solani]|uniref:Uncharacterized protein n=1 Tax=Rhizoctonia solani TaxID=456999 RepID=A0A8H2XPJ4_9AGAM|nr:unnamed protein product [Rhizoctonia solani]
MYRAPMRSNFGWRFVAVLILLLSMSLWYLPGGSQVAQWLSTAVDKYCEALTVLVESVTAVFGLRGNVSHTAPASYLLDTHEFRSRERHRYTTTTTCFPQHPHISSIEGNSKMLTGRISDNQDSKQGVRMGPVSVRIKAPIVSLDGCTVSANNRATYVTPTSSVSILSPKSESPSTNKHERVRKYAKMRTLKPPGKSSRSFQPLSQNELAVRRANERAAIKVCQREKYCARELAGDGIFIHFPIPSRKPQSRTLEYFNTTRQIRHKTTIGPMNPSWGNRYAMEVPTIKICTPDDTQIQELVSSSGPAAYQPLQLSSLSANKQGGSRSDGLYIPHEASPLAPTSLTYSSVDYANKKSKSNVHHIHSNKSKLGNVARYKLKVQAEGAKRLNKIRTNMSDWLVTIGAGSNSLVAEHVAEKAGQVLRASPI